MASVPLAISAAELSSIETAVGELGQRVSQAADELMGTPHEDVGVVGRHGISVDSMSPKLKMDLPQM